jgi:hypothetical protein
VTENLLQRLDGPAVERQLAFDMSRRGLLVAPVLIGVASAIWGVHGGLSAAFSIGLAVLNLILAATIASWAARVSLAALAVAVLGGYLLRLVLLTAVVFAIRHQDWVSWIPLAMTLVVTHLGLLLWETRYVSATLAYPGLKPRARRGA